MPEQEVVSEQEAETALVKPPPPLPVRMLVSGTVTGMGLVAALYLLNPGWGWIEILPDGLPLVGNLDEAGATALVLMVLSYWGFDVTRVGGALRGWSQGGRSLPPAASGDQDGKAEA